MAVMVLMSFRRMIELVVAEYLEAGQCVEVVPIGLVVLLEGLQ